MKINIVYFLGWSFTRLITRLLFRIRVRGVENIPTDGGFLIASNHISYYDPLVAGSRVKRAVHFMAKKELFKSKLLGALIRKCYAMPVRRGVIDRAALENAVQILKSGEGLVLFPEGTRSKTEYLLAPKPGIGMIAHQAGVPVVPCYLHGTNKLKRCFLGQERMSLSYGPPITPETLASLPATKETYLQVAQLCMDGISELRTRAVGVK